MGRKPSQQLTGLELEVMQTLWESSPSNVVAVQKSLKRKLAYTTVQTVLNILHRKGHARRQLRDRAYFYSPVSNRHAAVGKSLRSLIDRVFAGSAQSLVMNLIQTKALTPEELAQLQKSLTQGRDRTK
jgi:BlaI family transcriptional regulator, penicillinase repressor